MAKKKAVKKATITDRSVRKETYTVDRLKGIVEHLREQSMRLAGIARGMADAKIAAIAVDGHAMLLRGLNQTDNFADNCSRAVREAKSAR